MIASPILLAVRGAGLRPLGRLAIAALAHRGLAERAARDRHPIMPFAWTIATSSNSSPGRGYASMLLRIAPSNTGPRSPIAPTASRHATTGRSLARNSPRLNGPGYRGAG